MAKGKGKSNKVSGGPRRIHGPKRHLHHEFKPMVHLIAQSGALTKYNNFESFCLACTARGKKNTSISDFKGFIALTTKKEKDEYFKKLSLSSK